MYLHEKCVLICNIFGLILLEKIILSYGYYQITNIYKNKALEFVYMGTCLQILYLLYIYCIMCLYYDNMLHYNHDNIMYN
jgi:hypothetical protein